MSQLFTSSAPDIRFHTLGVAPAVLSTEVARHFQRRHSHILREIDRLRSILPKSFCEPNFGLTSNDVPGPNGGIRQEKAYLLSRDALSLLVMGMTGKAAILWKLRYIEAFNRMEARLAGMARLEAKMQALALPETRAAVTEAARRVWRLGTVQKRRLRSVIRWRRLGLGIHAIARLLDCDGREVALLLKSARDLGWLDAAPRQGNLLEACHA